VGLVLSDSCSISDHRQANSDVGGDDRGDCGCSCSGGCNVEEYDNEDWALGDENDYDTVSSLIWL
jgi:hypothetical protein